MVKQVPSAGRVAIMAGFALSCFGLLLFLWQAFGGPIPLKPQGYRFSAHYRDATQLADQADVRISGVSVGRVVDLGQERGLTRAEIELDREFAPIPADTRTTLRLKTLLGETYVELTPGTSLDRGGKALPEGGELPVGQTRPTVELDEVLRAFDKKTRRDAKVVLQELGRGVEQRGPDLSAALGNAGPAVADGARVAAVLRRQRRAVRHLIADSATVLEALSERDGALRSLVSHGSAVLDTTARRDRALTETVRILPTFLDELRSTLTLARTVGGEADPLLEELSPAARDLSPTLREVHDVSPSLRALFVDLDRAIGGARRGLPALTGILSEARPLVEKLDPVSADLVPLAEWAGLYKRELASVIAKLAAATQAATRRPGEVAPLHVLRILAVFAPESLAAYDRRLPGNRHNAYAKPGYLERVASHLLAFDCSNSSGSEEGSPPCEEQGAFEFRGHKGTFPNVTRGK